MQLIELRNVYKRYNNGVTALCDVNLTIGKGEFVFVIGASHIEKLSLGILPIHQIAAKL